MSMIDLRFGDCLEIMKDFPDESVDCVVTDPPYKVITGGIDANNPDQPKGMLSNHNTQLMRTIPDFDEWLPEAYRVLKEGSHGYVMTNAHNLVRLAQSIERAGFKIHTFLVWQKNNCTPSRYYMKNCEYTIFFRKGKAKSLNDIGGSKTVHSFDNIIGKKVHPTEKPVELMEFYIKNSTKEGEVVLDPFMGSGSTGVACRNLNRGFIGVELYEDYFNIARNRVEVEWEDRIFL